MTNGTILVQVGQTFWVHLEPGDLCREVAELVCTENGSNSPPGPDVLYVRVE